MYILSQDAQIYEEPNNLFTVKLDYLIACRTADEADDASIDLQALVLKYVNNYLAKNR